MRKLVLIGFVLLVLTTVGVRIGVRARRAAERAHAGTAHIAVSGGTGAVFTGHYVRQGQRVAVSNSAPWVLDEAGVSSFELRKQGPEGSLVLELKYEAAGVHAEVSKTLGPGVIGLRGRIENGLMTETFRE